MASLLAGNVDVNVMDARVANSIDGRALWFNSQRANANEQSGGHTPVGAP